MATWDDVARLALALPETVEATSWGTPAWKVRNKTFVWERPLRKGDLAVLGADAPPEGTILGACVDDLGEKEAVLDQHPDVVFTIPHFNGYPAVLVRLDRIDVGRLTELIVDAWLAKAPKRLAQTYLAQATEPPDGQS